MSAWGQQFSKQLDIQNFSSPDFSLAGCCWPWPGLAARPSPRCHSYQLPGNCHWNTKWQSKYILIISPVPGASEGISATGLSLHSMEVSLTSSLLVVLLTWHLSHWDHHLSVICGFLIREMFCRYIFYPIKYVFGIKMNIVMVFYHVKVGKKNMRKHFSLPRLRQGHLTLGPYLLFSFSLTKLRSRTEQKYKWTS